MARKVAPSSALTVPRPSRGVLGMGGLQLSGGEVAADQPAQAVALDLATQQRDADAVLRAFHRAYPEALEHQVGGSGTTRGLALDDHVAVLQRSRAARVVAEA